MKYNKSMAQILADMNENAIEEGKMKQLAMMIKQKKSPEQIAKALKVDVKTIKSLMGEQEGEGPEDPIDQAKKKIDKIKKIAILKKQMADIQKSEDTDVEEGIKPYVSMMRDNGKMKYRVLDKDEKEILVTTDGKKAEDFFKKNYNKLRAGSIKPMKEETELEEKVEYIEYKFRNSKQAVDAVRFVQAMNTGVPRNLDINSDQENKGIIVFDAGKDDFTKVHKMIVQRFRPQILTVENKEKDLEEAFTRKDFEKLESTNDHTEAAKKLIDMFGTSDEKKEMNDIKARHEKTGYINGKDYSKRQMMVNKYYSKLK